MRFTRFLSVMFITRVTVVLFAAFHFDAIKFVRLIRVFPAIYHFAATTIHPCGLFVRLFSTIVDATTNRACPQTTGWSGFLDCSSELKKKPAVPIEKKKIKKTFMAMRHVAFTYSTRTNIHLFRRNRANIHKVFCRWRLTTYNRQKAWKSAEQATFITPSMPENFSQYFMSRYKKGRYIARS